MPLFIEQCGWRKAARSDDLPPAAQLVFVHFRAAVERLVPSLSITFICSQRPFPEDGHFLQLFVLWPFLDFPLDSSFRARAALIGRQFGNRRLTYGPVTIQQKVVIKDDFFPWRQVCRCPHSSVLHAVFTSIFFENCHWKVTCEGLFTPK